MEAIAIGIIILVLSVFQGMQWVSAITNLWLGEFTHKSDFLIALIPGGFFYYAAKKTRDLVEEFFSLL